MTYFYFVGMSSNLKRAVEEHGRGKDRLAESRRIKAKVMPWAFGGMFLLMVTFILGGAPIRGPFRAGSTEASAIPPSPSPLSRSSSRATTSSDRTASSTPFRESSRANSRAFPTRADVSLLVTLHRRTNTDEVPITIDVVDAGHRRPELVSSNPRRRKGGLLTAIGVRPFVRRQGQGGVGRVLQKVVALVVPAFLDRSNLLADLRSASQKRSSSSLDSLSVGSIMSVPRRERTWSARETRSPSSVSRCPRPRRPPISSRIDSQE